MSSIARFHSSMQAGWPCRSGGGSGMPGGSGSGARQGRPVIATVSGGASSPVSVARAMLVACPSSLSSARVAGCVGVHP